MLSCYLVHPHRSLGADRPILAGFNAILDGTIHPSARDLLVDVRAGLLQKRDPVTDEFQGYRPLGVTEKLRVALLTAINKARTDALRRHFTEMLPEDLQDQVPTKLPSAPPVSQKTQPALAELGSTSHQPAPEERPPGAVFSEF